MAAVETSQTVVGDVSQEPSTFKAATTDYQPKNIMITGGAGFIVRRRAIRPHPAMPLTIELNGERRALSARASARCAPTSEPAAGARAMLGFELGAERRPPPSQRRLPCTEATTRPHDQLPTPHPTPPHSHSLPQASHFVIMMVKKYPYCRIINFDKLDYCSCLKNLDGIKESPNYK